MQVFPRDTTDFVADQFVRYYKRKKPVKLSPRDAAAMIDNIVGPAPRPAPAGSIDYARPKVSGGGKVRPTDSMIESIMRKYIDDPESNTGIWDAVFDEILQKYKSDRLIMRFINLAFRDCVSEPCICAELNISTASYYLYRNVILTRAAIYAAFKGASNL